MKGAIAWFTENHVAANLLMIFVLLAGSFIGLSMKLEVFPEYALDKISITVAYPGASPAEVEEGVIRRIEENIAGLEGIKRIDSKASESLGVITVEVMSDWEAKKLLDEIKAEVDRITTLPEESEKPVVREVTQRSQVISVAVFGDASEMSIKKLAERVKDDITNLPGITQAELFGTRLGEVQVSISEENLRRYGLTLGQVAGLIGQASLDLPAGSIKTAGGEILIRTKGRRYWADDYRDIAIITRSDGSTITLGQIAEIRDGFEDRDLSTLFQGKPAAVIQVFRVADQSALDVAETVKQYMDETRPNLPAGLDLGFYQDMSELLKSRISLLLRNMAMGLVLVSILLGLFLNLRLAFWVTLGIPISFLAGLMVLPQFDISINMVSLFAFIMVLGIVVDDAIIIGENIFQKREEGLSPMEAAKEGAVEVGLPVIFSVLTTIVAFVPLLMGSGSMGKIMRNLPWVVIMVLLGSLLEALFILPSHLARSRFDASRRRERPASRWLKSFIKGPYYKTVKFCVRWRYATVSLGIMVLLLTLGTWTAGWLKFTFFPKVESDTLQCLVTMPAGTPVERTVAVVENIEQAAKEAAAGIDRTRTSGGPPILEYTVAIVGLQLGGHGPMGGGAQTGSHLAHIVIQLLEGEQRNLSADIVMKAWREQVGIVPDAESITFQSDIFQAGNPVEVHLSMDDNEQLLTAADELKENLRKYPGVFDVADSFLPGKKELQLDLKPQARSLGLTLGELARQVRHAFYGAEALRLQRDQDEVKVMVRYPEAERKSLGSVEEMRIRLADGSEVPFSQVASVRMEQGYASIERAQRRRVVKVTADVDENLSNANEVRQTLEKNFLPDLLNAHPGLRYTIEGEGKEQKESLADVAEGFILALFAIYTLLAIPFKSFTQPLIVMAAIPFGIAGALVGHLIMGYNLSLLSLFGIVGLAGVVVNDSLVLIDAANRRRLSGSSPEEAILEAGQIRFRAVLLTSLTTFAGLTPMIFETSLQARFLIPMAVSLGFGVLSATGITLLLIPSGYMILEDLHNLKDKLIAGLLKRNHNTQP